MTSCTSLRGRGSSPKKSLLLKVAVIVSSAAIFGGCGGSQLGASSHPPLLAQVSAVAPPVDPNAHPGALTVSGGVSLGSYQAGYLHFFTEAQKLPAGRADADIKLVTGASAGTINALLSILSLCAPSVASPEQSLFYNTWLDVGAKELFYGPRENDSKESLAALSRAPIEKIANTVLHDAWYRGMPKGCTKVLGASATRQRSTPQLITGGYQFPRQTEHFRLLIEGNGPGVPPTVRNYVASTDDDQSPLLPFPLSQATATQQDEAFGLVKSLLLASSAFPVAFAPVALKYCSLRPPTDTTCPALGDPATECGGKATYDGVLFVDGGVFDNTPLPLAESLSHDFPMTGAWPPVATLQSQSPDFSYWFVDTDTPAYPRPTQLPPSQSADFLKSMLGVVSDFVGTARSEGLASFIQEHPKFVDHLTLSRRNYPTASGLLADFFGFFERSFREFDFYLGMYDAYVSFARPPSASKRSPIDTGRTGFAVPSSTTTFDRLACLLYVYEGKGDAKACVSNGEGVAAEEAFRILAQVSIERLFEECRHLQLPLDKVQHLRCSEAQAQVRPPLVPGVKALDDNEWQATTGESDINYMVRLLGAHGFVFADLDAKSAGGALAAINHDIQHVVAALASRQPFWEHVGIEAAKPAVNFLHYVPPTHSIDILFGRGSEVSWTASLAPTLPEGVRFSVSTVFTGLPGPLAVTPLLGLAYQPPFNTSLIQIRFGLRGGYQLSAAPDSTTCTRTYFSARTSCTSVVAQAPISASLLERLVFQITPEWFLPHDDKSGAFNLMWNAGIQLNF